MIVKENPIRVLIESAVFNVQTELVFGAVLGWQLLPVYADFRVDSPRLVICFEFPVGRIIDRLSHIVVAGYSEGELEPLIA